MRNPECINKEQSLYAIIQDDDDDDSVVRRIMVIMLLAPLSQLFTTIGFDHTYIKFSSVNIDHSLYF